MSTPAVLQFILQWDTMRSDATRDETLWHGMPLGRESMCYSWEVWELPGVKACTAPFCWAVHSVTWYTTHCWATHQKTHPVLQVKYSRDGSLWLSCKTSVKVFHKYKIQLDKSVTTEWGRSTACQLPWEESLSVCATVGHMQYEGRALWQMNNGLRFTSPQKTAVLSFVWTSIIPNKPRH